MSVKQKSEQFRSYMLFGTTFIALASTIVGGIFWVDDRYAKAAELQVLEERVALSELRDQLRTAMEELYFWRQQVRKYPEDPQIREEKNSAQEHVDELKNKLKELK